MFRLKIKILLLEIDELETKKTIEQLAKNPFYDTEIVPFISGEDLIHKLNENKYDVIIFDFLLDFDVIEIMQLIRSNGYNIPIIFITQLGLKDVTIKALQMGAFACIKKTEINYHILIQMILSSVEKQLLADEEQENKEDFIINQKKRLQILYNLSQKSTIYYDNELLLITLFKDLNQILEVLELSLFLYSKDASKLILCKSQGYNGNKLRIIRERIINSLNIYKEDLSIDKIEENIFEDEQINYEKIKDDVFSENCIILPLVIAGSVEGVLSLTLNKDITAGDYNMLFHIYLEILNKIELSSLLLERKIFIKKLKKAQNVKNEFLSKMSDELKAPLIKVIRTSNMLLQSGSRNLSINQLEDLTEINRTVSELSEAITNIIEIADLESGNIHFEVSQFNIIELIDDILASIRDELMRKDTTIEIIRIKKNIEITSDIRKVREILNMMIVQTVKFLLFSSKIIFDIDYLDQKKDKLKITVSDPNVGVDESNVKLVFESYFENYDAVLNDLKGVETRIKKATKLSELLGGSLDFTQKPGKGSSFIFELPINFTKK